MPEPPSEKSRAPKDRALALLGPGAEGLDAAIPELYAELRRVAGAIMRSERRKHTLQPTAVVHEAYLRLRRSSAAPELSRTEFAALAASVIRRILVDHARRRNAAKRRPEGEQVPLEMVDASVPLGPQLEDLHLALERLAHMDSRQARLVELRYFGGLAMAEVASVLGVSKRTAEADWTIARAWLRRELEGA